MTSITDLQWPHSGHEILKYGKHIQDYEILNAVKAGELTPYNKGQKVIDLETATRLLPKEEIKAVWWQGEGQNVWRQGKHSSDDMGQSVIINLNDYYIEYNGFSLPKVLDYIYEGDQAKAIFKERFIGYNAADERLEKVMQEARKKGGSAQKKNAAIMEAVKSFILQNPRLKTASAAVIAQKFRKYKSTQPFEVTVGSTKYEIFYDGGKIFSECSTERRNKYHDKSVAYSTFQATYICKVKSELNESNRHIT